MGKKLTPKEQAWSDAWLETFNKTEAARRAKYRGNDITLASIGYENFRKPHIQEYIKTRLEEKVMTSEEVLSRFAEEARLSIADFLDKDTLKIDPKKVHEKGHLVKSITHSKYGPKLELYDAQAARLNIGKQLGLFSDKHVLEVKLEKELDGILAVLEEVLQPDVLSNVLSRLGNEKTSTRAISETSTEEE